jgi:DNA-binding transcriptional LysR family regulator
MLDQLDALRALRDLGTMGEAAARLRLTSSAVSKRIAALEALTGAELVVPDGRRVRLTAEAERILSEAEPLLLRLSDVLRPRIVPAILKVAASESLLSSWLPAQLRDIAAIELHAHRGPMLVEKVRTGAVTVAVCAGAVADPELSTWDCGEEPMGIVGDIGDGDVRVWTIEERSLTWASVGPRLDRRQGRWGFAIEVVGRLESFTALAKLADCGFGAALVPQGVADAMGVRFRPLEGLARPIVLVGRPSAFERDDVRRLASRIRPPGAEPG